MTAATFRDPAGSLRVEGGQVLRTIGPAAREAALAFLGSPFCRSAQQRGDLIPAEIDDSPAGLVLRHPRIPFPAYPWEWTPSQWLAAAELTLNLCDEALDSGLILKDATPLNILFTGARPVFVDILSFEPRDPAASLWLAYGQYVRTFLLPLVMRRKLGWPLALSLFKRDGCEPADCYAALGWSKRLSRDAFWPITLPTLLDRRKSASTAHSHPQPHSQDPQVSLRVLRRTLNDLRRRTRRAARKSSSSSWSSYTDTLAHYTPEQMEDKRDWVRRVLQSIAPTRLLDIGANTGDFSVLAAQTLSRPGTEVVAIERDVAAADGIFRTSRDRNLPITTICADIARPTPAAGWENAESLALLPRLEGQFDCVLMLAVIHHLILMEQVPLPAILSLCARLTRRHLVLEWVPVEDPMYQSLMRGRDALYGSLSEADLLAACQGRFAVRDRHPLTNGRILFLLEKAA